MLSMFLPAFNIKNSKKTRKKDEKNSKTNTPEIHPVLLPKKKNQKNLHNSEKSRTFVA